MKAVLLPADLDELERIGTDAAEAFRRGAGALGMRPVGIRLEEPAGTDAAVAEVVHAYAQAYAEMRLLEFEFAMREQGYVRSKARYEAVDDSLFDLRRHVVPALRARLQVVREREAKLVLELEARGVSTDGIGPVVDPERAQVTSARPGEGEARKRTLSPLAPRPSFLDRLRRLSRSDGRRGR